MVVMRWYTRRRIGVVGTTCATPVYGYPLLEIRRSWSDATNETLSTVTTMITRGSDYVRPDSGGANGSNYYTDSNSSI